MGVLEGHLDLKPYIQAKGDVRWAQPGGGTLCGLCR